MRLAILTVELFLIIFPNTGVQINKIINDCYSRSYAKCIYPGVNKPCNDCPLAKAGIPCADESGQQEAQNDSFVEIFSRWQRMLSLPTNIVICPLYRAHQLDTDGLVEIEYLVGQNDLYGQLIRSLIS